MRLAAMGFAVTATQDPEEALAALGARGFDVALVDLRMEPMDGIALTRAAHARQARLPVLIMTAHGTIENAVQAIKEGAFDFLTKPFVTEELRGKLARALSERRWARDRTRLRTVGDTLISAAIDRVLDVVAQGTMEATETERAVVFLREDGRLVPKATAGASATPLDWLAGAAEAAMARNESTTVTRADRRLTLAAPLLVRGTAEGAVLVENPTYGIAGGVDAKQHRVVSNLDAAVGALIADAREVETVFLTRLVHALDAMEPHGTLTVRSRSGGENGLEVSVEDAGCGMDAEARARMFDL